MKNRRENFLISGIVLIVLGALFSLGVNSAMGGVMGISGILCFIIGMSVPSEMEMSREAIANWQPSMERLPDAGRFMYRVDVTLDEPIKSTILGAAFSPPDPLSLFLVAVPIILLFEAAIIWVTFTDKN